jgi:uncharacterized membrane protein (DUF106 family)
MFLGIAFMIGVFFPSFRIQLAEAISPILKPLLSIGGIHIVIFILSSFTALYSTVIQKYTIDYKRMKEINKRIVDFQKKYMKAVKENNQFLIKQLEKEQGEIRELQAELMSMNFRSMFYTVVVTIPIWAWLWYVIYDVKHSNLSSGFYSGVSHFNVIVPFAGKIHVSDAMVLPWWLFWYILCSITVGQIIKKLIKLG